ncbi:hypothetical protein GQ42DRAFT_51165 [Ramicandelaber brevisporus]|nr:hypothetical protein GQ42DRAFT_51165 [Ramicandelaber brevisporus]
MSFSMCSLFAVVAFFVSFFFVPSLVEFRIRKTIYCERARVVFLCVVSPTIACSLFFTFNFSVNFNFSSSSNSSSSSSSSSL